MIILLRGGRGHQKSRTSGGRREHKLIDYMHTSCESGPRRSSRFASRRSMSRSVIDSGAREVADRGRVARAPRGVERWEHRIAAPKLLLPTSKAPSACRPRGRVATGGHGRPMVPRGTGSVRRVTRAVRGRGSGRRRGADTGHGSLVAGLFEEIMLQRIVRRYARLRVVIEHTRHQILKFTKNMKGGKYNRYRTLTVGTAVAVTHGNMRSFLSAENGMPIEKRL